MPYYLYRGKLSSDARSHILRNAEKFDAVMKQSVSAFGGELVKCFLDAAGGDPIGFLIFDSDTRARAWSIYYGSQDGVLGSDITRLLETDEICEIGTIIGKSREKAEAHRRP